MTGWYKCASWCTWSVMLYYCKTFIIAVSEHWWLAYCDDAHLKIKVYSLSETVSVLSHWRLLTKQTDAQALATLLLHIYMCYVVDSSRWHDEQAFATLVLHDTLLHSSTVHINHHLSLNAPVHSLSPHGLRSRIIASFSRLNRLNIPVPSSCTLRTAVTE